MACREIKIKTDGNEEKLQFSMANNKRVLFSMAFNNFSLFFTVCQECLSIVHRMVQR
jgi:hypothetical protein